MKLAPMITRRAGLPKSVLLHERSNIMDLIECIDIILPGSERLGC